MHNQSYMANFLSAMCVERNLSKATLESYEHDLKQFVKYMKDFSLCRVSTDDVRGYIRSLFDADYTKSSVSRKVSSLNSFYKFLVREGVLHETPIADAMISFGKNLRLPKFLTESEIQRLIKAAKEFDDHGRAFAIVSMMYSSGMRISELISLRLSSVKSMLREQFDGIGYMVIRGKGSKERAIILNAQAIESLKMYLDATKGNKSIWLFPGANEGVNITRQRVSQIFKLVAEKAEIDKSKVSPHVIRHSFATHLLNRNADITFIQKQLGHASISTTEIYTHVAKDKVFNVIKDNHPLNKKNIFGAKE